MVSQVFFAANPHLEQRRQAPDHVQQLCLWKAGCIAVWVLCASMHACKPLCERCQTKQRQCTMLRIDSIGECLHKQALLANCFCLRPYGYTLQPIFSNIRKVADKKQV